jgi:hypothetical protein
VQLLPGQSQFAEVAHAVHHRVSKASVLAATQELYEPEEQYPRLGISERVDLLASLEHPDDGTPKHVALWLKRLIRMRNRLAHAWVLEATVERAVFSSVYRGSQQDLTVFDVEMARAFRMIEESQRSLLLLAGQVGDTELWGQLMGIDER